MLKNCFLILLLGIVFACESVHHLPKKSTESAIPTLTAFTDTGFVQLKIVSLKVSVQTVGNLAQTSFDISFYNNTDRVLEGEFDFPLLDGQNIFQYGLEVNGELREGVVVEKTKARVAYENTLRRGIDPGLVEKTKGNNFRTRIYPIPAKGYKRVVIGIEEMLAYSGTGYLYRLPLYARDSINTFSLDATVRGSTTAPLTEGNELGGFSFSSSGDEFKGSVSEQKFSLKHLFTFLLPFNASSAPIAVTEMWGDKTYCYTSSFMNAPVRQRHKPSTVAVLWDISSSSNNRNEEKDKELLRLYLEYLGNVKLLFVPFHIAPQSPATFEIKEGKTDALGDHIKLLEKEGGTQLGAIDLNNYPADEFLIFSDGISTFGRKEIHFGNKPVITVNSSPSADISWLKFLALKTNGSFIDLVKEEPGLALQQIQNSRLHVIKTEVTEGEISDLVFRPLVSSQNLGLACILKTPKAVVNVYLGFNENEVVEHKKFVLTEEKKTSGNVKRIWASMKIEELELEYEKNKEQVTALGKEYSIVTRNTSLLALDRVEDYVQYEIVPPAGLRKEYETLLKEKQRMKEGRMIAALDEALDVMEELKAWWQKDHRPTSKKKKNPLPGGLVGNTASSTFSGTGSLSLTDSTTPTTRFTPPQTVPNAQTLNTEEAASYSWGYGESEEQKLELNATDGDGTGVQLDKSSPTPQIADIKIKEWSPDAEYIEKIRSAGKGSKFSVYRELKKQYGNLPAYFVDVARYFLSTGDSSTALLILSNVAEMKLEDPELLRTMAYQLMEMKAFDLAAETFKEVKEMREEEPQSYRDLALAFNELGRYNEALLELNTVLKGSWDGRFGDVKSIALSELNAIISAHNNVDVSAIDQRLIFAMPVDVRIVIGWSANDSDIDLWVTDPRKEKCFYQNVETVAGGRITQDVTQGYGPEAFMIKKAVSGDYVVEANLYGDHRQTLGGPLTITAELFTDFGRPTQKRKAINFRVTEDKEVVKIGELHF